MARYKPYSYAQGKFIPILPGTFEYTLNHLIDHELDLALFDERFRNDGTGAKAYDPRILLKIVLYAYSRGIVSSRRIEQACRENVIFMALSADTRPHFTTIADFVSSMDKEIIHLFRDVCWSATTWVLSDGDGGHPIWYILFNSTGPSPTSYRIHPVRPYHRSAHPGPADIRIRGLGEPDNSKGAVRPKSH